MESREAREGGEEKFAGIPDSFAPFAVFARTFPPQCDISG
jgi:hypothetical protein